MKLGIMQPYFLPYIGYWQLIKAVDRFVVYDNIQYTKKGWFNRNRFLVNGADAYFTVPLKKDSDFLNVDHRWIAPDFDKKKMIAQFRNAYAKAPQQKIVLPLIEEIVLFESENLFAYIFNSILRICGYLEIKTSLVVSSTIPINHELKAESKVLAICKAQGATTYINSIGGKELYSKATFDENGVALKFIRTNDIRYPQLNETFVPYLSILDVLMFNPRERVISLLDEYALEDGCC